MFIYNMYTYNKYRLHLHYIPFRRYIRYTTEVTILRWHDILVFFGWPRWLAATTRPDADRVDFTSRHHDLATIFTRHRQFMHEFIIIHETWWCHLFFLGIGIWFHRTVILPADFSSRNGDFIRWTHDLPSPTLQQNTDVVVGSWVNESPTDFFCSWPGKKLDFSRKM